MISSANRIYSEFVQTEAPKQVNDCKLEKKYQTFKEFKLQMYTKTIIYCNLNSVDLQLYSDCYKAVYLCFLWW